ncbi:hypothetical protein [Planotetraspora kaengkrachanensis]|uniref:hypothetical protein n=1 Tax=Planotetraspora kaengkrachanensis TaxID=575193 RepID=UPI0019456F9B|nr:hypothetical protein [Planotetraspora kaengkrachanensis]
MFDTGGRHEAKLPVRIRLASWYCRQNPGGTVELADNPLACWEVTALHARYLAPEAFTDVEAHEQTYRHRLHWDLHAYLVDLDGGTMLPTLQRVLVHQDLHQVWWLREVDDEYLERIAVNQLPLEPQLPVAEKCCRYRRDPATDTAKRDACEVQA